MWWWAVCVPSAQTETGNLLYGYYTQPLHHLTHCSIQSVLWHEIEFLKSQLVWRKDNHLQNHSPLSYLSGQFDHQRRHGAIDNTAPLTAAVPNTANLTSILQAAAHSWMGRGQYKICVLYGSLEGVGQREVRSGRNTICLNRFP